MNSAAAGLILILTGSACSASGAKTDLLITFANSAGSPVPGSLRFTSVAAGRILVSDLRLPALGDLSPHGDLLGTVVIDLDETADLLRTLVARGVQQGQVVSEGTLRVQGQRGMRTAVTLRLWAGRLADGDGDGIPDNVDNCPFASNPAQEACGPANPDAAADALTPADDLGAGSDGGSASDAAEDASP